MADYVRHTDERGTLGVFDFQGMAFVPCRTFVISDVPAGAVRGGHAHRSGLQMLVCQQGRIEILMRCESEETVLVLTPSSPGLVFREGVWCRQRYIEEHSSLLVFASEPYSADSYIDRRDPDEALPCEVSRHE